MTGALNVSRQRPVYCTLELPTCVAEAAPSDNESNINWKKVDQACINNYQNILQNSEHMINIYHCDLETPGSIDQAYTVLVTEVIAAAQKCLPKKSFKHFLKPYWNQELKDLHKKMKLYRSAWIKCGKPRQPNQTTYTDYKRAKGCFRQCHKKHVHAYLQGLIEETDRLAEVDSAHFWRLVKARCKESNSSPGSEMIFEGHIANSTKEINIGWGQYFKKLYTPTQRDHFDNQVFANVTREVREIKNTLQNCNEAQSYPIISPDEVDIAAKLAQNNKAGGDDGIVYEHIKFGGSILFEILSKLYTAIIKLAHAPKAMKRGVIVTLFKGGNRRKDNPDNYRAITLSSVLLKLLERILLTRIELFDEISPPIHSLQGGFKKQQGCLITSFIVKEAIQYAKEKNSKVYACFLDVKKAFDQVWHDGLFYKLYKCGVNRTVLKTIINLYTDMTSCVRTQSHKSEWFPVLQGTRQGGVISPFLYLVYDNDLMWEIEASEMGLFVHNINCGSLAVADDKLALSLSKHGMDTLIKMCYMHSSKWRYELQPPKCVVIVFNESPLDYRIGNRTWSIGDANVEEDILYKHLGIYLNKYLSIDDNIKEAASKIKGTFLSLVNSGIHDGGLNPITSKHIHKSVVLPKALYGCELWYAIQPKHVELLEKSHRFCVKFMQSLPRRTSTDVALSLLNIDTIEVEIDYRKLIFFGQLCNSPPQYCAKALFIHRMVEYKSRPSAVQGFFADIYRLLGKYSLLDFFQKFENDGEFVSKLSWKRTIRTRMQMTREAEWSMKCVNSANANSIVRIKEYNREYVFWEVSRAFPKYYSLIQKAVRMLGIMFSGLWIRECDLCQETVIEPTEHMLLFCCKTNVFRETLWGRLLRRFGMPFSVPLYLSRQRAK